MEILKKYIEQALTLGADRVEIEYESFSETVHVIGFKDVGASR